MLGFMGLVVLVEGDRHAEETQLERFREWE